MLPDSHGQHSRSIFFIHISPPDRTYIENGMDVRALRAKRDFCCVVVFLNAKNWTRDNYSATAVKDIKYTLRALWDNVVIMTPKLLPFALCLFVAVVCSFVVIAAGAMCLAAHSLSLSLSLACLCASMQIHCVGVLYGMSTQHLLRPNMLGANFKWLRLLRLIYSTIS